MWLGSGRPEDSRSVSRVVDPSQTMKTPFAPRARRTAARRRRAPEAPHRWSFEIRIRSNGTAYQVHLLSSPAGDEVAELELPFSTRHIGRIMERLEGSVSGGYRHVVPEEESADPDGLTDPGTSLQEIGAALFGALFPPTVRRRWEECVEEIDRQPERGLRLVLKSDPTCTETADLHRLPWELLRDPRSGGFLALSRKTTVVRQISVDEAAVLDEPKPARHLRVLAVLSQPEGVTSLELTRERKRIEEAVAGHPDIELHALENPTFTELTETLRAEDWHVLHFMGHGAFDPQAGQSVLLLPGPDGTSTRLSAERLAQIIRDVESLRLVVLNACDTGRSPQPDEQPFTGLAHALVRGGVPAVIAMQLPIPDRAAIEMSRTFYRRLADGEEVDEALAEARVAVYAAEGTGDFGAWAVPVLFVRRPDLRIFRPRRQGANGRASSGGLLSGRWPRRAALAGLALAAAAVIALFFVRAPWARVEMEAEATSVSFVLDSEQRFVDTFGLVELAAPDLEAFRRPDPETGADRTVARTDTGTDGGPERLGVLASAADQTAPHLFLDQACLPAGTRIEIEQTAPRELRLALDLPPETRSSCGRLVTASFGPGILLRQIPGLAPPVHLTESGALSMIPRAGHLDLDLRLADRDDLDLDLPLDVTQLDFREIRELVAPEATSIREVSTLNVGSLKLEPLGGGEPTPVEVDRYKAISFAGLRGELTGLSLGEEHLRLAFRGRADAVTTTGFDGAPVDLMPTWSQTPWALRLGAGGSTLLAVLGFFGQVGGLWRWGAQRQTARPGDEDRRDD